MATARPIGGAHDDLPENEDQREGRDHRPAEIGQTRHQRADIEKQCHHLQQQVATAGLQQQVQFIGYLERERELPACYAAADVFAFASRTETQGLVLLVAIGLVLFFVLRDGRMFPGWVARVTGQDKELFAEIDTQVQHSLRGYFSGTATHDADLVAHVGQERIVTLTGSGGSGKTRLSLQVAADALERFPDGGGLPPVAEALNSFWIASSF